MRCILRFIKLNNIIIIIIISGPVVAKRCRHQSLSEAADVRLGDVRRRVARNHP